jgi:hypothetical protein
LNCFNSFGKLEIIADKYSRVNAFRAVFTDWFTQLQRVVLRKTSFLALSEAIMPTHELIKNTRCN